MIGRKFYDRYIEVISWSMDTKFLNAYNIKKVPNLDDWIFNLQLMNILIMYAITSSSFYA